MKCIFYEDIMRLTLQTDYALRVLMHLAVKGEALSTIAEIAEKYEISRNHLMKVAQNLVQLGFVESVRGRSGGLRLARAAGKISIGDVVRQFETGSALVECFQGGNGHCVITPACRLKSVLGKALEAFFQALDPHSVDELVRENTHLKELLKLADAQ